MKFGQLLVGLLLGALAGVGLTSYFGPAKPQSTTAGTPASAASPAKWSWADSLDAVRAAPKNHKVVYEDSTVRVLQVLLGGHRAEPVHTHQWKSIMWITKPAAPCIIYQYRLDKKGKFVTADSVTVVRMALNVGYAGEAEGPTGIKNLSGDSGVAYRIEFKKDFKP